MLKETSVLLYTLSGLITVYFITNYVSFLIPMALSDAIFMLAGIMSYYILLLWD